MADPRYTERLHVMVSPRMMRMLRKRSIREQRSVSDVVRRALKAGLKAEGSRVRKKI